MPAMLSAMPSSTPASAPPSSHEPWQAASSKHAMDDDDGALVVAAATITVGDAASDDVSTIEVRSNDMLLRRYRTAGMERTAVALIMLYALLAVAMFAFTV